MTEILSFGGRPVGIGFGLDSGLNRPFGLDRPGVGLGVGSVGDLLAYRQMWEPFIEAHLNLWREVNELLENNSEAAKCPAGIFDLAEIRNLPSVTRGFCASLYTSRVYTSPTHPLGILPQWNAWKNKSSAEILAGARSMLEWHQSVVLKVGGQYKDELVEIAKFWKIAIQLPDLPSFSLQDEVRARIEAAFVAAKGVIQLVGYGVGETLVMAGDVAEATAEGLKDTAAQLPKTTRWIGVAAAVTAVVVGGVLIAYYVPRRTP
jgi:hypothetical protein